MSALDFPALLFVVAAPFGGSLRARRAGRAVCQPPRQPVRRHSELNGDDSLNEMLKRRRKVEATE